MPGLHRRSCREASPHWRPAAITSATAAIGHLRRELVISMHGEFMRARFQAQIKHYPHYLSAVQPACVNAWGGCAVMSKQQQSGLCATRGIWMSQNDVLAACSRADKILTICFWDAHVHGGCTKPCFMQPIAATVQPFCGSLELSHGSFRQADRSQPAGAGATPAGRSLARGGSDGGPRELGPQTHGRAAAAAAARHRTQVRRFLARHGYFCTPVHVILF